MSPLATQLTWSRYTELLSIKDGNKLSYYINVAKNNSLSKRELREKIKSKEYNRLSDEYKNKIIESKCINISDTVPNPILVKDNKKYNKFYKLQ